jgi:hypothetical protein
MNANDKTDITFGLSLPSSKRKTDDYSTVSQVSCEEKPVVLRIIEEGLCQV